MLYPSSPSEAAADAPASPDPTTMIVCLRLLAGFTSFISKRAWSQIFSMGPEGTLESSGIDLFEIPGHHSDRYRDISRGDYDRNHRRRAPCDRRIARMVQTQRLQPA